MARRRIVNRKELRMDDDEIAQMNAAETEDEESEGEGEEEQPAKKAKKAPAKRKSRAKVVKEVRLKAFWGVFSQTLVQVAQFEYSQRAEADQKAKELIESKKAPHFVQLVKKVIEE